MSISYQKSKKKISVRNEISTFGIPSETGTKHRDMKECGHHPTRTRASQICVGGHWNGVAREAVMPAGRQRAKKRRGQIGEQEQKLRSKFHRAKTAEAMGGLAPQRASIRPPAHRYPEESPPW